MTVEKEKPKTTVKKTATVEEQKLKLFQIEFTSEEIIDLKIKKKISLVRGRSLNECYEYTMKLHKSKPQE